MGSFGTEQAVNTEVTTHLAHIATQTQRTSLYNSLLYVCPANIKHSNLQIPKDSGGSTLHTKADSKGRCSKEQPYDESPKLQSSCHKFCVLMVVFDGLRNILLYNLNSKFFLGEWALRYIRTQKQCTGCVCHMAAPNPLYVCTPFFNVWIHPWVLYIWTKDALINDIGIVHLRKNTLINGLLCNVLNLGVSK